MDKRKIIISALVVVLIVLLAFVLMLFLDKDEKKVYYDSEWIISEGEPKESTTAVEGDFYYDQTTNHLYQLKSKKWVLLGKISNNEEVSSGNNKTCEDKKCEQPEVKVPVINISEDGFLLVNGVKTGSSLKGKMGTKGDDGAPGQDGKDGKSPVVSIGEEGYIYIDDIKLDFKEYKNGCYQITDSDNDKELDIGEEVKCNSEYFNVVYNNGNKVHLLAKFNLDVGQIYDSKTETLSSIENPTGIQSSKALGYREDLNKFYGVVPFSEKYYWGDLKPVYGLYYPAYVYDSNSKIFNYLQTYKNKLIEMEAIVENVRLPRMQEIASYICFGEEDECNQNDYPWILNTSFWTGTAEENKCIIFSLTNGFMECSDAKEQIGLGIRPLVEMLDENIQR